jgi:glyoxylase-like metal-dependent hydrolase (beta-lactamase superfamily II)/rhodanese-related sulfurtransferase
MYFKQFYLGCLAHASYLIGSDGEAAVVDPQRDVDQYITEAEAQGFKIKHVIETHLHADFVSGHRELAARTGADIIFGAGSRAEFTHRAINDGEEINLGRVTLRFLHTPGHTPESISILVVDNDVSPLPQKVLTGDALFIGDVGRPDLAGGRGYTAQQMAASLYESLHGKLLTLDDSVEVFPAHGAGSMCGRNISKETSSTIGEQRRFNYALQPMAKDEFVRMMTADLQEAPAYFPRDAEINRTGAPALEELARPKAMVPEEVNALSTKSPLLLDIRSSAAFGAAHVPGALNIALSGQFATWCGTLIGIGTPIVLIADEVAAVDEAVMRLARVGIESVAGYLDGGIQAWDRAGLETEAIPQMPVDELHDRIAEGADLQVVDVRRPGEYAGGHVPGAINLTLAHLEQEISTLNSNRPTAVICASGYRSSAATSLLERHRFTEIYNIVGGTNGWVNAGYAVESPNESADK